MQQVKKQLQDAIKKLKSDWGINEVKREDLAAVLEKVVAALDRAAQLPVAPSPAGRDFDKHFFRVVVVGRDKYNYQGSGSQGSGYPAVAIMEQGPMTVYKGFFDHRTKDFFELNQDGQSLEDLAEGRMLYNRKTFFTLKSTDNIAYGVTSIALGGYDEADNLNDPNWVF